MSDDLMYQALGAYTLMLGIWSIVGLLFYVWYLWALSRLFPQLGLPSAHGWIPVWNQWRLIERGGLPGWLVLLGFVPGLALVVIVVSIIAIHRINQEQGEGAGMTVLGALIPPLWATLLGNKLRARDGVAQGVRPGDAQGRGAQGRGAQAPGAAQGGPAFQGAPFAAANTGLVEYGPDGQPYPLLQRGAPQPPVVRPQVVAPPAQNAPLPPAPPLPPAQNGAPAGPPAAQPAPPAAPQQPARYQAPGVPTPAENQWVIGRTIDSNFERLANEEPPARRDASFGSAPDARPFSWPEPMASVPPAPPAPPVASAPPAAPQAAPPATPPAPPAAPPAAVSQAPAPQSSAPKPTYAPPIPQAPAQQPPAPAQQQAPAAPAAPAQAQAPAAPQKAAAAPAQPEPAQPAQAQQAPRYALPEVEVEEGSTATVLTGAKQQPIAEEPEEELDRTVVVSRRQNWVLELPDGSTLDLEGDDVVIGRRPSAVDGSSVLLVPDPTRTLSKSHARLRRNGESWTIEDLKSTNGVFVFDDDGSQIEVEPGEQKPASEQLIIGTLEVRLRTAE